MKRFHSLDALRGIAALSVVVWHWQHFLHFDYPPFDRLQQPLYWVFVAIYRNGPRAVDLFFCLSGFIFHWLYSAEVARGGITAREFFVRRLARLYPLHLATLLIVTLYFAVYGPVIYRYDAYHFVLNLLLVCSIGLEKGFSFNGPAWSLSVEVALYMLFFVACRFVRARLLACAVGVAAGMALWPSYEPLARGLVSFFLGGGAYLLFRALPLAAAPVVRLTAIVAWLATLAQIYVGIAPLPEWAETVAVIGVLFPATVLALALTQASSPGWGRRLAFLGDASYSIYLIHFPLQLAFMRFALDFTSPLVMAAFFAVLLALAMASHRYFEWPVQGWIRRALDGGGSAASAAAPAAAALAPGRADTR